MDTPKLVVVGSVAYDSIETDAVSENDVLGGSATHFSLAAAVQGVSTGVVAVVDKDFKAEHIELLRDRLVDTTGLDVREGKTFRWGGKYDSQLKDRETLYTHLNVFETFRPRLPDAYRSCPYLFLANIDPDLQHDVLGQCTGPKWVGLDTMNLWIANKRESLERLLPKIDALYINDTEAHELTGERNILKAARWVQERGTPAVVIKKGEHGAVVVTGDGFFSAPAFLLENVVDPTGAGDSFAGGMAAALARRDDVSDDGLRCAMALGTVTASFCVEELGPAKLAGLEPAALSDRLAHYRCMVQIPEMEL